MLKLVSILDLTQDQIELSQLIHEHVEQFPDDGAGLEALLPTVSRYTDAFQYIMESATEVQRDYLCERYAGLNRFTQLMQILAELYTDKELDEYINQQNT